MTNLSTSPPNEKGYIYGHTRGRGKSKHFESKDALCTHLARHFVSTGAVQWRDEYQTIQQRLARESGGQVALRITEPTTSKQVAVPQYVRILANFILEHLWTQQNMPQSITEIEISNSSQPVYR